MPRISAARVTPWVCSTAAEQRVIMDVQIRTVFAEVRGKCTRRAALTTLESVSMRLRTVEISRDDLAQLALAPHENHRAILGS